MASLATKFGRIGLYVAVQLSPAVALAQKPASLPPNLLQNNDSVPNVGEPAGASTTAHQNPQPTAAAQRVVLLAPQALYPIGIRTRTPGRRFEVLSNGDVPIARCIGNCYVNLPMGDYKAIYYDAHEQPRELPFSVEGPGRVDIEDANESAASTGLLLGITGPLLAVAGLALMVEGMSNSCLGVMAECYNQKGPDGTLLLGGLGALAAGAVLTPVGWVMYSRNRAPRLVQTSLSVSVAVAPVRNGAFLGIAGHF